MNKIEYEKMYLVEDSHWWYVGLHDLILHFVAMERKNKDSLDIFDAGCGTGRLCKLMTEFGNVSGCDASELAVKFCNQRKISSVFQADLNVADMGRDRYDVITSIDVLCHKAIQDDSMVLKKFYVALKPGGVLILNLPAYNFFRSHHDVAVHTERRYTKTALVNKLKELGFIIEKASYRVGYLFIPIAIYRLLQRVFIKYEHEDGVSSDVEIVPVAINKLLLRLNRFENYIIEKLSIPFGTSVFAIARKPLI